MFSNYKKVCFIGDIHNQYGQLNSFIVESKYQAEYEIIVQLGDFGIFPNQIEISKKTYGLNGISSHVPILFTGGNHSNWEVLNDLTQKHGRQPIEIYNNIFYLPRGCLTQIGNKKCLSVGGAFSIDKQFRVENKSWWKAEEPDYQDCQAVLSHSHVDFVIAHTVPEGVVPLLFERHNSLFPFEYTDATQKLLDEVVSKYKPSQLFAGHWHLSDTLDYKGTTIRIMDTMRRGMDVFQSKGVFWDVLDFS
jgi:hypothetical protein